MIRSFEYAAAYAVRQGPVRTEDIPALLPWASFWQRWASASFLRGYFEASADADYLNLLSDVFGSGKNSRLYKRLVYQDQIATNVSS